MKESDDLELYLQSFENEMTQLEVNPDRWKALITVRLTPKMKGYICDIQQNPASSYQDVKACLLSNAGLTRAQAGARWFSLSTDCMKGKSTGEVLQLMDRLLNRMYDNADTQEDHHARLILARIKTRVDKDFRLHLDSQAIQTRHDLRRVLESWESSHGGFGRDEGHKRHSSLVCHKCHKPGHKAYQCRNTPMEQSMLTSKQDIPVPRCYTCGTLGHKTPECPRKTKELEESKPKDTSKRKDKYQKIQAAVSLHDSERLNMTIATLFGQNLPILLDTGAEMTVVPQEMIPPAAHTGNEMKLRSFDGGGHSSC